GAAEVEHALAGPRLDERAHRLEPQLRPRGPLEVLGCHRVDEALVVLGRSPAEGWQPHRPSLTESGGARQVPGTSQRRRRGSRRVVAEEVSETVSENNG